MQLDKLDLHFYEDIQAWAQCFLKCLTTQNVHQLQIICFVEKVIVMDLVVRIKPQVSEVKKLQKKM